MKNILLVDDDIDDTDLFKEALHDINPDVKIFVLHSGLETMKYFQQPGYVEPDIIFIDVNMPIISGWDCLEKIKLDPFLLKIPVIMYSTSSYRGDADKAILMGAVCFFTKPSNYASLKKILSFILTNPSENIQSEIERF